MGGRLCPATMPSKKVRGAATQLFLKDADIFGERVVITPTITVWMVALYVNWRSSEIFGSGKLVRLKWPR
jgi:hypothetical protein